MRTDMFHRGIFVTTDGIEEEMPCQAALFSRKMKETRADTIFKEFWRPNERFADLFNAVLFQGWEVITPDSLTEMDTDVSGTVRMGGSERTLARARDVVKKSAYGIEFMVLGIENQQSVHYAMPLRNMIYDAMGYLKEYEEIVRSHRKRKDLETRDEFLSRLKKEERLHPMITLTVYYGEKRWDGPCSLRDMVVEMPASVAEVFSDYKMNLLEVLDSGKYRFNNREVRTVFDIMREIFAGRFDEIRKKYKDVRIGYELLRVIGKMTGSKEIMEMSESKGVEDMCTALEELKEQGRQLGVQEGRQEGKIYGAIAVYRDFDMPEEEIAKKLQMKFGVTPEEAAQYLIEQRS